jgi:site-specific DNA recombinase
MKIVGYCRVSTDMQGEEGHSLAAQSDRIRTWARERRAVVVEVLSDTISGCRADNRPGLQAAVSLACREKAALVVCALSRLARSTRDALNILTELDAAGADLVSLTESIDTTHAAGKMVFRLLSVLAEFERDLISERIRAVFLYMRRQGKITGSVPFGFNRRGGFLVLNPREQAIIRYIHQLRRKGFGYKRLQEALQARGMRTKTGNRHWSQGTLWKLLRRYHLLTLRGRVPPAMFYAHGQTPSKVKAVTDDLPCAKKGRQHAQARDGARRAARQLSHARKLGTGARRAAK